MKYLAFIILPLISCTTNLSDALESEANTTAHTNDTKYIYQPVSKEENAHWIREFSKIASQANYAEIEEKSHRKQLPKNKEPIKIDGPAFQQVLQQMSQVKTWYKKTFTDGLRATPSHYYVLAFYNEDGTKIGKPVSFVVGFELSFPDKTGKNTTVLDAIKSSK